MPNKGKKKKRSAESQREQPKRQPAAAIAARAKNKLLSSDERLQAITQLADLVCKGGTAFKTAVALLKDTAEPSAVRLAALQALQTAAFGVVAFEPCQADYVEALRSLMDDPDAEVRQRVLGSLTRKEDAVAQQRLIDGLRSPDQALVPAEKALQLLSADVHTEAYDVAREILEKAAEHCRKTRSSSTSCGGPVRCPCAGTDTAGQKRVRGGSPSLGRRLEHG
jgi:hypothetical protein